MKQVLISDSDNNIIINLESNTMLSGFHVNAEYNIPEDYKIIQLEKLTDILLAEENKNSTKNFTNYRTNDKIISTYEDVVEHFKPASDKYFITGITDSKANLITKYFKKSDFLKTEETLKPTKKFNLNRFVGNDNNELTELEENYEENNVIRTKTKLIIPGLDVSAMILSENDFGLFEYVLYIDTKNPIKYVDLGDGLANFMFMRSHEEPDPTVNMVLYDDIIEEPKILSEVFIDRGLNTAFERTKKLKNIKSINELSKTQLGYYRINTKGYDFKKQ